MTVYVPDSRVGYNTVNVAIHKSMFCFVFYPIRENEEQNLAHTVFTQYINENENQMEAELAFDASFFKANRKVPGYYNLRKILSCNLKLLIAHKKRKFLTIYFYLDITLEYILSET